MRWRTTSGHSRDERVDLGQRRLGEGAEAEFGREPRSVGMPIIPEEEPVPHRVERHALPRSWTEPPAVAESIEEGGGHLRPLAEVSQQRSGERQLEVAHRIL